MPGHGDGRPADHRAPVHNTHAATSPGTGPANGAMDVLAEALARDTRRIIDAEGLTVALVRLWMINTPGPLVGEVMTRLGLDRLDVELAAIDETAIERAIVEAERLISGSRS